MPVPDVPSTAGRLRVAVFAGMAEAAGRRTLELDWNGGTVADLRRGLKATFPELGPLLDRSAVACGDRYATDGEPIAVGDDVALIPPVSGG
jgi:molybdopterin converting factor small subunit